MTNNIRVFPTYSVAFGILSFAKSILITISNYSTKLGHFQSSKVIIWREILFNCMLMKGIKHGLRL